ncbi:MAG: hypothetical protein RRY97_03610, partial [Oscillibacter sp.]
PISSTMKIPRTAMVLGIFLFLFFVCGRNVVATAGATMGVLWGAAGLWEVFYLLCPGGFEKGTGNMQFSHFCRFYLQTSGFPPDICLFSGCF